MTLNHDYENSQDRNVFRFRKQDDSLREGFDLKSNTPHDYAELSEDEKLSVAELMDFINAKKEDLEKGELPHFRMRNHDDRPQTTNLEIGKNSPEGYEELSEENRNHVCDFISFLIKRR
jgi:uncharacterized protein YfbU (UPF0304 family)